jgi:fluoroacetyl-CoA thioesterase
MREPTLGAEGIVRRVVTDELSADRWGNSGVHVLSTPALAMLFELAAIESIADVLEEGELSVGAELQVRHLAATPVGMEVTVSARLIEVRDRLLEFEVTASDAAGPIGEGSHVRAVLDRERFERGVDHKRAGV